MMNTIDRVIRELEREKSHSCASLIYFSREYNCTKVNAGPLQK